ncbi:unnamed protein product [Diamesa hyperborea]
MAVKVKDGSLKPFDGSLSVINITGLEQEMDSYDREKREISNHYLQMDPSPTQTIEDEIPEDLDDYISNEPDTDASLSADTAILQDINLPLKAGSPAFKIIASKVYILYPSMFQDPNIFGRFSIPQSINMEGKGDLSIMKDANSHSTDSANHPSMNPPMPSPPQPLSPAYLLQKQQYDQLQLQNQQQGQRGVQNNYHSKRSNYRRQPIPIPSASPAEQADPLAQTSGDNGKERNIVSHMKGQIVVQNQDVNEYNTQKGY